MLRPFFVRAAYILPAMSICKTCLSASCWYKLLWLLGKIPSFIQDHIKFLTYQEIEIMVARVVKSKLAFMKWFFNKLVMLIKLYKIRYLNLDKALLFPRNQAICMKNRKLCRAPTTAKFNIFCWNFAHVSYLRMSIKACSGFFYFV